MPHIMITVLDYAPVAATAFAVPQFLPQILKLRATGDTAGVSWAWATLTCVNNAAWFAYFTLAHYWTALIPSSSATTLATTLAILLSISRRPKAKAAIPPAARAAIPPAARAAIPPAAQAAIPPAARAAIPIAARAVIPIAAWAAMLAAAGLILGRAGLGALLTAAFAIQVAPSLWTAYRTARPTGVSAGTWLLILGELTCWLTFGLYKSDPRLITLGLTGVTASALMLARIHRAIHRAIRHQPRQPIASQPRNALNPWL